MIIVKRETALSLAGAALLGCMFGPGSSQVQAQAFSKADSGWVRVFNGQNFDGFYSRMYGQAITDIPNAGFKIEYPGTDTATIRVSSTSMGGHIGTDRNYSNYRVRLEYRFDRESSGDNAGLTYHGIESVPRMSNNWPRSIECQMMQSQTGWAFSIQQVTFDTRIGSGHWDAAGAAKRGCEFGCDARQFASYPLIRGGTHWNRMEVIVRGADSAIHRINDTTVFKLWNIRIYNDKVNGTPDGPYGSGNLSVQAEGALIRYRRWEIMEFPKETPKHFLHRLFLDNPNQGVVMAAQSTYAVKWRTLGDIATVNIEYNTGSGGWKSAAMGVSNTGSYDWKVPNEMTKTLKLRISGPAWAAADSSDGNNEISTLAGVAPANRNRTHFLTLEGRKTPLVATGDFSSLEIREVSGRVVRRLSVGAQGSHWDLRDSGGERVGSGLYFLRWSGPADHRSGGVQTLSAWVF
jgi:hypothetical protein